MNRDLFEVIYSVHLADGERHEERALYRGHPGDPAADLIEGRDLARGDNAVHMNSSASQLPGKQLSLISVSRATWDADYADRGDESLRAELLTLAALGREPGQTVVERFENERRVAIRLVELP